MADGFVNVSEAFKEALERIKDKEVDGIDIPAAKIYVWRQRFNEGKLSHKKVEQILQAAGFKKVVEEQWISIEIPKTKNRISIDVEDYNIE